MNKNNKNKNKNNMNNTIQQQQERKVGVSLEFLESVKARFNVQDDVSTHQLKVKCYFNLFALSRRLPQNVEVPSVADLCVPASQKGDATYFVTHSYKDSFNILVETLKQLEEELEKKNEKEKSRPVQYFFIDLFCLSFSLDSRGEVILIYFIFKI